MSTLIKPLRRPGVTYHHPEALASQIEAAEVALRSTQYRALLAPTIAEAKAGAPRAWIFGAGEFGRAALAEARQQGLEVVGVADADTKLWNSSIDGVKVSDFASIVTGEPLALILAVIDRVAEIQSLLMEFCRARQVSLTIYSPGGHQAYWSFAEAYIPKQTPLYFGIEILNAIEVRGFCPADTPLAEINLKVNGQPAGNAEIAMEPEGGRGRIEFRGIFQPATIPTSACTLELVIKGKDGSQIRLIHTDQYPTMLSIDESRFVPGRDEPFLAPFPYGVALALHRFRPDRYPRSIEWDDSTLASAIADIRAIDRDHSPVAPIRAYLCSLRSLSSRFAFIRRRFPRLNAIRKGNLFAPDAIGAATIPDEVLAISHHLYVLSSYGGRGTLAEFGCFKGLSTSMLSLACRETGFRLEVFDSFEGLPGASITGFNQPGEFAGALADVQARVAEFGAPELVNYTKGFFSSSLRQPHITPACIWMDVDLRTSIEDVLNPLFTMLPRHSCVFSHDIRGDSMVEGRGSKQLEDAAVEVVVPILDAYERQGRPVSVRPMAGFTTAFWETGRGLPVLPGPLLLALIPEPVIN